MASTYTITQPAILQVTYRIGHRPKIVELHPKKEFHNYHPLIAVHELRRDFPKSTVEGLSSKERLPGIYICRCTCSICLSPLIFRVVLRKGHKEDQVDNNEYMVTPCKHIFHAKCLKLWMKRKMKCPLCQRSVPLRRRVSNRKPTTTVKKVSGSHTVITGPGYVARDGSVHQEGISFYYINNVRGFKFYNCVIHELF